MADWQITKHEGKLYGKLSAQTFMLRAVAPHSVMLRAVAASRNKLKMKWVVQSFMVVVINPICR
jgi:hypothetical protein